jgi:PIN domain nuclease of toxin-antitoxin system
MNRMLVDTHVMLWWLNNDARLSLTARAALGDPGTELMWSLASSWEIAVKVGVGKLRLDRGADRLLSDIVVGQGMVLREVRQTDCVRLAGLPLHHRDPFDRMLVATAQADGVPLLSADDKLRAYDVEVVW